jgi:acetyltransferase-like isoleucine patch superfamily enzyme
MSAANPSASSSTATSNRPPVTLPPTTHLDPGAYIRGVHPITFGEHVLVHPRALLNTNTHPLTIGNNVIISEKTVLGGAPASLSSSTGAPTTIPPTPNPFTSPDPSASNTASPALSGPSTPRLQPASSQLTRPTTLHSHIHIHPSAQISHSTTVHSHVIIEAHAVILPGLTIGFHSKICANVTVTSDVPEWTVVYGSGNQRRSRKPAGAGEEAWKRIEEAEALRARGMDRDREATSALLRNAARAAVAAKRQSVQR